MKRLLLVIVVTMLVGQTRSYGFSAVCSSGQTLYYSDISNDNTVSIYNPKGKDSYEGYEIQGDLIIPETVTYEGKTYIVTEIDNYAFYYCSRLKSIIIPNSIMHIGRYAFAGCDNLTSIVIEGNPSIYEGSYFTKDKIKYEIRSNNIVNVMRDSYTGDVVIPETVTFGNTFTVTSLASAFENCVDLTSITIPNSITWIGYKAFSGCRNLTSVTIPKSVTDIGDKAFEGCASLKKINIPNSVTNIGKETFAGCSNLQGALYGNAYYLGNSSNPYMLLIKAKSTNITTCSINGNCKTIYTEAFSGCENLTSIAIPKSVKSIYYRAFYDCSSLKSITIPSSVTYMGEGVFKDCTSLTIYCQAKVQHSKWDYYWNPNGCYVVWGAINKFQ